MSRPVKHIRAFRIFRGEIKRLKRTYLLCVYAFEQTRELSKKRNLISPDKFKEFISANITENTQIEIDRLQSDSYYIKEDTFFGFIHYPRLKGQSRRYLREMCHIYLVSLLETFLRNLYTQTIALIGAKTFIEIDPIYAKRGGGLDRAKSAYATTFGISLAENNSTFERIREIFDRRHLLTHCDGLISNEYRAKYDKFFTDQDKLRINVLITPAYLINSIELIHDYASALTKKIADTYGLEF